MRHEEAGTGHGQQAAERVHEPESADAAGRVAAGVVRRPLNAKQPGGFTYEVVRTRRRTMALRVTRDGRVEVRCPLRTSLRRIEAFVEEHREWVLRHLASVQEQMEERPVFTEAEIRRFREQARRILSEKAGLWARRMGVTYNRIAIRQQSTRWGSCSAKGNLNFNWVLVLLPEELQDYVVVHELAHRREMNHSLRFWAVVEEQLPDYAARRKKLKDYAGYVDPRTAPADGEDESQG